MLYGLFLDPRAWTIDLMQSSAESGLWRPEDYGVKIDLHSDAFNISKKGIDKKYRFVIATEVWEIPMRKSLEYLRKRGLKIFLLPREPFKTAILKDAMFSHQRFYYNNEYYFTPDVVLAPGEAYADLWKNKTKVYITGYPRFDYYANKARRTTIKSVKKAHKIEPERTIIFFPSFPPYNYKKVNGHDTMVDLFDAREEMIGALRSYAMKNNAQIVIKIHPASMKPFKKGTGNGKEVSGLLKKYYDKPDEYTKVIGDVRTNGFIAKDLLLISDIVCGFTSTMLLEAALFKKPAIHMLLGNTEKLGPGIPEYAQYIPTARNENELHDLLKNAKYIENPMVEKYLYKIDGKCCKRICKAIKENVDV